MSDSRRAIVLLPLPLSPTRATICLSSMDRSTSSTACRKRRDSGCPTRKWRLRPAVRRIGSDGLRPGAGRGSAGDALIVAAIEMAANEAVSNRCEPRLLGPEARFHQRAARGETAARRGMAEVGRRSRDPLQHLLRTDDRWKRLHQRSRVRMLGIIEDLASLAELDDLPRIH